MTAHKLAVPRYPQPDDLTCGPTCLLQVMHYWEQAVDFGEIFALTRKNPDGGTLSAYLGLAARGQGFGANIYPYKLDVFDPSWHELDTRGLLRKLARREKAMTDPRLKRVINAYEMYLRSGGNVKFVDLDVRLLKRILDRGRPILTGLSATYLYQTPREHDDLYDDIAGQPVGHFVVIAGYRDGGRSFQVCDPATHVPLQGKGRYWVPAQRLLNAILLGAATYDATLLEVFPQRGGR